MRAFIGGKGFFRKEMVIETFLVGTFKSSPITVIIHSCDRNSLTLTGVNNGIQQKALCTVSV